jgi:hypothetical protein
MLEACSCFDEQRMCVLDATLADIAQRRCPKGGDTTMTNGTHVFRAVVSLSLIVCACGAATRPGSISDADYIAGRADADDHRIHGGSQW